MTDAEIILPGNLINSLTLMGHTPFVWQSPDGYPDSLDAWATSVLRRWEFASQLFDGNIGGVSVDLDALLVSEGGNFPGEQGEAINRILTGGQMDAANVALVQGFYDDWSLAPQALAETFGLAGSMPDLQWY